MISKRCLKQEANKHPETMAALENLYRIARKAAWQGLHQVREQFPSADQVGSVLIFNILGGRYRLITRVSYSSQTLFVKALLTHREYDRKRWMQWA